MQKRATEISGGVYWYPLSQAETNAKALALIPVSGTANVLLSPVFEITIDASLPNRPRSRTTTS